LGGFAAQNNPKHPYPDLTLRLNLRFAIEIIPGGKKVPSLK
jgi:hypothetical protein